MKPLSLNSKIWLAVTIVHIIGLFFISSTSSAIKPTHKKLVVMTKQYTPKSIPTSAITKIENKTPLPLHKKILPIKNAAAPKKSKPALKKPEQKSSKQVLKKIDQRLAKPHTPLPKVLQSKIIEDTLPLYIESACGVFRDALMLPEKGQVKLTVSVDAAGKIGNMEIETFESKKNLEYLMAVLPTLLLPLPEKGKETTFTVLFCND